MVKKKSEMIVTKCPHCGEEVKNLNINYCLNCGNMLWSKSLISRTRLIR
ncbi:MAG: hypothetical protein AB1485_04340 [Candidatus Thermoplasmatota archaeon]